MSSKITAGSKVKLIKQQENDRLLIPYALSYDLPYVVEEVEANNSDHDLIYLKGAAVAGAGFYAKRFELVEESLTNTQDKSESTNIELSNIDLEGVVKEQVAGGINQPEDKGNKMQDFIGQLNQLTDILEQAIQSPVNADEKTVAELTSVRDDGYNIKHQIIAAIQTYLSLYDEAMEEVEDAMTRLQVHIDNLDDQVQRSSRITLTVEQFKQVIRSGKVIQLEGKYIDYADNEQELRINDANKIRPPVDVMSQSGGTLEITNIELLLKTNKLLDYEDIKAILPEGC